MKFIEINSIKGNKWSFRIDQIAVVTKKLFFEDEEEIALLDGKKECTVIKLINGSSTYYSSDSYDDIMAKIKREDV